MSKKSQGLSLNTIIIAAICLVVLIVLIAIFSGRINIFGKTYTESQQLAKSQVCWSQGGYCENFINDCREGIERPGRHVDCGENQKCCAPP